MLKAACPSCGAELTFDNKASLFAVCPFCSVASVREDINLRAIGQVAELQDDGTPIQIGTTGSHRSRAFRVLGRRQMSYDKGFWNEWFLEFQSGPPGWLGEAMGQYSVFAEVGAPAKLPGFSEWKLGWPFDLQGARYWAKNILPSEVVSAEGELPFAVAAPTPCPTVDLAGEEFRCATLDYGGATPRVFVGRFEPFDSLNFKNLRRLEGW